MSNHEHNTNTYKAFMIRLWQDDENAPWRASVQMVRTGETIHFASVLELLGFVRAQASTRLFDAIPGATNGDDAQDVLHDE